MRATVWGCRGSVAAPGPETIRYGGNTPCVEVRTAGGGILILDAGTGIRALGIQLAQETPSRVDLLLSHLHLDHLVGLGFFAPLFQKNVEVHVWGPRSPVESLQERIARYLSPPLFPVRLTDMPSLVELHDVPEQAWSIGSVTLRADSVSHNGPTLGYRIEEDGRSLTYIPDHEPAMGGMDLESIETEWISGFGLATGADVLLHDAQYTHEEYGSHVGWGHSSLPQVVTLARRAGVGRLVLFHHDPLHTDEYLETVMLAEARRLWGDGGTAPELAYEGMELAL